MLRRSKVSSSGRNFKCSDMDINVLHEPFYERTGDLWRKLNLFSFFCGTQMNIFCWMSQLLFPMLPKCWTMAAKLQKCPKSKAMQKLCLRNKLKLKLFFLLRLKSSLNIYQSIFICVLQKKGNHTGLERRESVNADRTGLFFQKRWAQVLELGG